MMMEDNDAVSKNVLGKGMPNISRFAQTQVVERRSERVGGGTERISMKQRILDRNAWSSKRLLNRFTPLVALERKKIVKVCAGSHHSVLLDEFGNLFSFGHGGHGQLGLGNLESSNEPKLIPRIENVKDIAAGFRFTIALTEEGRLYSWGTGEHGELGHGRKRHRSLDPRLIESVEDIHSITSGTHHVLCTERNQMTLLGWGRNANGQLGVGDRETRWEPTRINETNLYWKAEIVQVSAGPRHSALVTASGDLWTWGRGRQGQLCCKFEDIELQDRLEPKPVENLQSHLIMQVSCGENHTAVLTEEARVLVFGGVVSQVHHKRNMHEFPEVVSLLTSHNKPVKIASSYDGMLYILTGKGYCFAALCETNHEKNGSVVSKPLYHEKSFQYLVTPGSDRVGKPLQLFRQKEPNEEVEFMDALVDDMLLKTDDDGADRCKNEHKKWDVFKICSTEENFMLYDRLGNPVETYFHTGKTPFYLPEDLPERASTPGVMAVRAQKFGALFRSQYAGPFQIPATIDSEAKLKSRTGFNDVMESSIKQQPVDDRNTFLLLNNNNNNELNPVETKLTEQERIAKEQQRQFELWKNLLHEEGWRREIAFGNYIPFSILYDIQQYGRRLEDDNSILELRRVFYEFDTDGSGEVDADEMRQALKKLKYKVSKRKAKKIVKQFDKDGNGCVGEEEFLDFCFDLIIKNRERGWFGKVFGKGAPLADISPPPLKPPQFTPARLRRKEAEEILYRKFKKTMKAKPRVFADTYIRFVKAFMRECVEMNIWGTIPKRLKHQLCNPSAQPLYHRGEIDLYNCEMTDGYVKAMCIALRCAPVIKRLDLRKNRITAVGARMVAELLLTHDRLADYVDGAECITCGTIMGFENPRDARTPGISCSCSRASQSGRTYYLPVYWLEHVLIEDPQSNKQKLASKKLELAVELDAFTSKMVKRKKGFIEMAQSLPSDKQVLLPPVPTKNRQDLEKEEATYTELTEDQFRALLNNRIERSMTEFRQICLEAVSEEIRLREIRRVFLEADKDNSGYLDFKEMWRCLDILGIKVAKARAMEIFKEIDEDDNGFLTRDEFEVYAMKLAENSDIRLFGEQRLEEQLDEDGKVVKVAKSKKSMKSKGTTKNDMSSSKNFVSTKSGMGLSMGSSRSNRKKSVKNFLKAGSSRLSMLGGSTKMSFIRRVRTGLTEEQAQAEELEELLCSLSDFGHKLYRDFHKTHYRNYAHSILRKLTKEAKLRMYHDIRKQYHAVSPMDETKLFTTIANRAAEAKDEVEMEFKWTAEDRVFAECRESVDRFQLTLEKYYCAFNRQVRIRDVVPGQYHSLLLSERGLTWIRGFQDDGNGDKYSMWKTKIMNGIKSIETVTAK